MKLIYPAIFTPCLEKEGYTVTIPDLPGCVTEGDSLLHAIEMGIDASSGWILGELEEGNIQLTNLHNSFVSDVAKATTVEEIDELLSTFKTDVDELVAEVNKPVDPDNGDNKDDDKTNVSCLSAAYISSLLLLFSLSAIIIKRKQ